MHDKALVLVSVCLAGDWLAGWLVIGWLDGLLDGDWLAGW